MQFLWSNWGEIFMVRIFFSEFALVTVDARAQVRRSDRTVEKQAKAWVDFDVLTGRGCLAAHSSSLPQAAAIKNAWNGWVIR